MILKAKPYWAGWAAFNNQSYIKELTVGNAWVSLGYSNDLFQAQQDALKAKRPFKLNFSLQQEGNTLSMDNLVILKDAPRKDLAHKFINFMLDGKNAAKADQRSGRRQLTRAAMPNVKPEITKLSAIFPSKEALPKLQQLQDLNGKQRRELNKAVVGNQAEYSLPLGAVRSPGIGRAAPAMTPPILPSCRRPHRCRTGFALSYLGALVVVSLYPFTEWEFGANPGWISAVSAAVLPHAFDQASMCWPMCRMASPARMFHPAGLAGGVGGAGPGGLTSLVIEITQLYLPYAVASNLDVLCNAAELRWLAALLATLCRGQCG